MTRSIVDALVPVRSFFAHARRRLAIAWHVLRGRPVLYRCHFHADPTAVVCLVSEGGGIKIVDCVFDGPARVGLRLVPPRPVPSTLTEDEVS